MIDEFQYMNRHLYHDAGLSKQVDLCYSYMGAAESKVAPLLVTGLQKELMREHGIMYTDLQKLTSYEQA